MRRIAALTISCLIPLSTAVAQENSGSESMSDFPVVPVSSIAKADSKAKESSQQKAAAEQQKVASKSQAKNEAEPKKKSRKDRLKDGALEVTPGVNEIIPIAVGHPNRFSLPFSNPKIRTTSSASFEVEGNSLYVSSDAEGKPVTAFLTEKGSPELALSVTFVPKRIAPIDMTLKVDPAAGGGYSAPNKKAKAWEESQPYIQTIRDLLRDVANNEIPQGYTLNENPSLSNFYGCQQPGLSFKFKGGQSIEGHQLKVNIGVVQNLSKKPVEFREPSCAGNDVKAVAAWPNPLLQPGQKTEIYVVRDITQSQKKPLNSRNSLLEE